MSHTIGRPDRRAARPEVKALGVAACVSGQKSGTGDHRTERGSDVAICRTKRGATATITSSAARRPSSLGHARRLSDVAVRTGSGPKRPSACS